MKFTTSSLFTLVQIDHLPCDSAQMQAYSSRDIVLSKVLSYTKEIWPSTISENV